MSLPNINAEITMREIKREFTFDANVMLTLSITYPQVRLLNSRMAQDRINNSIRMQVIGFYRYVSTILYQQAIGEYRDAILNEFPFRAFDAVMVYEITYNDNCYLSTYHDQYEYTGGAHGNTVRSSDTWNLNSGKQLPLSYYFQPSEHHIRLLLDQILQQADDNMQQNPGIYFEDYRKLIVENFNPDSYFLATDGISIYYQQYDIAPYSTGIVVFTISYEVIGWQPSCPASIYALR